MFYNQKKQKKGFTLIEVLISVSLFTIVTTIAFTALFSIMDANDKAKTIKLVVGNLSTAMESMTREIRVGKDYTCNNSTAINGGQDCSNGNSFSFISESGENILYSRDEVQKTINRRIDSENTLALTGQDVNVDKLAFYVESDGVQPRVLIILQGSVSKNAGRITTSFELQTTISQRGLSR